MATTTTTATQADTTVAMSRVEASGVVITSAGVSAESTWLHLA
jgi:hypothetical protein